jgi:hypothetical protein
VLGPGKRAANTTKVYGVVDYLDDATEKIFISIGPCTSTDPRFAINFESSDDSYSWVPSWGGFANKSSHDSALSSAHRPRRVAPLHLLHCARVRSV